MEPLSFILIFILVVELYPTIKATEKEIFNKH